MGLRDGSPGHHRCLVRTRLVASNLSVLNQYVTSPHRMSTEVLHLVLHQEIFPSQVIDEVVPVPRVQSASTQMAAMGLWRPLVGPGGPGLDTVFHSDDCPGYVQCLPNLSG